MKLIPVMRTDEHHIEKHNYFLGMQNRDKVDVVFLGDSITRRWEDNIDFWNRYFREFFPLNMGVGSDCIEHILWRVQNGELEGLNPKLFLVLGGTNNITQDDAVTIVDGIIEIVRCIHAKCKDSKIIVFGILPRGQDDNGDECQPKVNRINESLLAKATKENYQYEYYGDVFIKEGTIDKTLVPDGLHPDRNGFEALGPVLQEIIRKYI